MIANRFREWGSARTGTSGWGKRLTQRMFPDYGQIIIIIINRGITSDGRIHEMMRVKQC